MEIWLVRGDKERLLIPVNPESIGIEDSNNYSDITLANGDEKTVMGGRNLKTYSIKSFFPNRAVGAYYSSPAAEPMDYVRQIESWLNRNLFIRLQVTGIGINTQVTIRSFNWEERGGSVGDIDYTIELKEYLPITYTKIEAKKPQKTPPKTTPRPPSEKSKPKTYTVVKGDNLWNIAKKHLGSGSKWPQIYNKNKGVIGKNPNLIFPGQKLIL